MTISSSSNNNNNTVLVTSRPITLETSLISVNSSSSLVTEKAMHRRSRTNFNPMFSAMISSNILRDCSQVQAMMTHCLQNHASNIGAETPFVCQTAEQYYQKCSQANGFQTRG